MKLHRILMVFGLMTLAQWSWGQVAEAMSGPGNDPIKAARIYPNPAIEYVSVKFEAPMAKEVRLELHSIIGNSLEVESEIIDDYEVRVKVKDLPAGYYLLDVKGPGASHGAFKFLKR